MDQSANVVQAAAALRAYSVGVMIFIADQGTRPVTFARQDNQRRRSRIASSVWIVNMVLNLIIYLGRWRHIGLGAGRLFQWLRIECGSAVVGAEENGCFTRLSQLADCPLSGLIAA